MEKTLSIVMPAYNEARSIEKSLLETLDACQVLPSSFEVIVVNDCSTDDTLEVVRKFIEKHPEVRILNNERNLGFGGAFRAGVMDAKMKYVTMVVADDGIGAQSLATIWSKIGQADLVVPFLANPQVRNYGRRFLSWSYVHLLNLLVGMDIPYYNGHNIYPTQALQRTDFTPGFAYAAEIVVRLVKDGHSVIWDVPMHIKARTDGETKAFRVKNIVSVVQTLSKLFADVNFKRDARRQGLKKAVSSK